ncbi:MAG: glycosyltransferase family 39 protein [Armatimonadetes bacterium]|nr:glycosyltransferase family 39 protein [Armatimonadota bacterium]
MWYTQNRRKEASGIETLSRESPPGRVGPSLTESRYRTAFWIMLVASAFFRLWYATRVELHPDEAYYWQWSRHLAAGYYDQGPMIGWVIAFFTRLFGHSELSVRLQAVLTTFMAVAIMRLLALRIYRSERAAFLAAFFATVAPLYFIGGILATYDTLQMLFWSATLLCLVHFFQSEKRVWWLWTGIAFGLGLLSKCTMTYLLPVVVLTLLAVPRMRRWLVRPEPYLGLLVGTLVSLPFILWNARNDWATVQHLAIIGTKTPRTLLPIGLAGDFLASQLVVLTPFLGISAVVASVREARRSLKEQDPGLLILALACILVLSGFVLHSMRSKIEANWPATAYCTAFVLLGGSLHRFFADSPSLARRRRVAAYHAFSAFFAALLLALTLFPGMLKPFGVVLPAKADRSNDLYGWSLLAREAERYRRTMPHPASTYLFGSSYQIASELAFYTGQETAHLRIPGRRVAGYDYWNLLAPRTGQDALFVEEIEAENPPPPAPGSRVAWSDPFAAPGDIGSFLAPYFNRVESGPAIHIYRPELYRQPVRSFRFYRGFGFKGYGAALEEAR